MHDLLTRAGLRSALTADGLDLDVKDEEPATLAREVSSLADDAYVRHDPARFAQAESLLYVIHIHGAFTVPVQSMPGLVWSRLMARKIDSALARVPLCPEVDAGEMRRRLAELVDELGAHNHPMIDALAVGERGLVLWTKNWFGSTRGFSRQLTSMALRCSEEQRKFIVENLADEFDGISHFELRMRFMRSIGLAWDPDAAMDDPDRVMESFALTNLRSGLTSLPGSLHAFGAMYSVEANWARECERLLGALRRRGIEGSAVETFRMHAEADVDHADGWVKALEASPMSGHERARVVDGARLQLLARRAMYDAILARVTK